MMPELSSSKTQMGQLFSSFLWDTPFFKCRQAGPATPSVPDLRSLLQRSHGSSRTHANYPKADGAGNAAPIALPLSTTNGATVSITLTKGGSGINGGWVAGRMVGRKLHKRDVFRAAHIKTDLG